MAVGIIAEYNPFHNGHHYHLQQIRRQFGKMPCIAVMSGSFVQRGGAALLDKWLRTQMALCNGVDLVLELPVLYASQSAEIFAKGAICLLHNTGIVNHLIFGSESADIDRLKQTAQFLTSENEAFQILLRNHLHSGSSYALARSQALQTLGIFAGDQANDILGIEYIKQLFLQKSLIRPHTILRKGSSYNSLIAEDYCCSATAIRHRVSNCSCPEQADALHAFLDDFMPRPCADILKANQTVSDEDFYPLIRYAILQGKDHIKDIFDVNEGLEHRIYRFTLSSSCLAELIENIKSKRYTVTRIRRILFNILLGITKEVMQEVIQSSELPYLRILGFNEKGRESLKEIKKLSTSPLINKVSHFRPQNDLQKLLLRFDTLSTDIYHLVRSCDHRLNCDQTTSPIYFKVCQQEES